MIMRHDHETYDHETHEHEHIHVHAYTRIILYIACFMFHVLRIIFHADAYAYTRIHYHAPNRFTTGVAKSSSTSTVLCVR